MRQTKQEEIPSDESDEEGEDKSVDPQTKDHLLAEQEDKNPEYREEEVKETDIIKDDNRDDKDGTPV